MPSKQRVDAFIAMVLTNKHDDAIAAFYAEDASIEEPGMPPRQGLATLVAGEKAVLASVASVVTHPPDFVAIDGDRVAIHWTFDFVNKEGKRRHVTEVAIQEWREDKILRERFFYDKASAAWK
ncbi:MAG: nuclear transport factor 2 family protein [Kofleriaceae bacterium]